MEKTKLKFADFPWHSEFEYYTEIYYDIWEIIDKAQLNEYSNEFEKCRVLLRAYSLNLIFEEGILKKKQVPFEDLYNDIFHHTLEDNPSISLFNLMKLSKSEYDVNDFEDEYELKVEICKEFYKENIKFLLSVVIPEYEKEEVEEESYTIYDEFGDTNGDNFINDNPDISQEVLEKMDFSYDKNNPEHQDLMEEIKHKRKMEAESFGDIKIEIPLSVLMRYESGSYNIIEDEDY